MLMLLEFIEEVSISVEVFGIWALVLWGGS
jgi:hypothetical protein